MNVVTTIASTVDKIHQSSTKVAMAIAGGGSEAIGELLKRGGGSATVIEAVVPYDTQSFISFLERKPDKFCDEPTALQLAMAAYRRAQKYTNQLEGINGIGFTSSLVKPDGEREGRKHNIFGAIHNNNLTTSIHIDLDSGKRTREEEETFNALMVINAIARCADVKELALPLFDHEGIVERTAIARDDIKDVINKKKPWTMADLTLSNARPPIIYAGSWNPFHETHRHIIETTEKILKQRVDLELTITNADKAPLDYLSIDDRLYGSSRHSTGAANIGRRVFITSAPTFLEKAYLWPGVTFVVGYDTAKRIVDPIYYGGVAKRNDMLNQLLSLNCKFVIFGREENGEFKTEVEDFPRSLIKTIITEKLNNVSSTEIRKNYGPKED